MPEPDEPATAPAPCEHVVFTDLGGDEAVLVDLDTKSYFRLNGTASLVWRGLARQLPVDQIALDMTARYDVSLEDARASVEAAVGEFLARRLVRQA